MDNHKLGKIQNLPDTVSPEQLVEEFKQLLIQTKLAHSEDNLLLLDAYFELSNKQWHTYRRISPELLDQIDLVLINLWDKNSIESTEAILGIVAYLGLVRTFEKIKSALDSRLLTSVRKEILDAIEEFGANVADPYSEVNENMLID
jgi:hypothetical protein